MPHSNDRTIISAAGDSTVRIFDVEYSGSSAGPSSSFPSRPRSGGASVWENTRHLSEGDTNAKVFRSHSDRVKRIVTESSPFFFLTCSEDGEVRQWDLREPESTYPTNRTWRFGPQNGNNVEIPPPLISYRRYNVDLNTISCSPSRPHYIALGGNHLHCFLHDRRMLGRDVLAERGTPASPSNSHSSRDDDLMGQATQCVRRFAPNGQPQMGRTDTGHITACKISDANPNELIASWSGDHIYSFDIVNSSDARESTARERLPDSADATVTGKVKESRDRKRKRVKEGSTMSLEAAERAGSRARTSSETAEQQEDLSLRVNFGNGQREEIPIEPPRARSPATEARESHLPEFQRQSFRIAKGTVQLRKALFSPELKKEPTDASATTSASTSLARYSTAFSRALSMASSLMPDVLEVMRSWRYPVNPVPADVTFQRKLRKDREKAARFVQAAGVLARVLGGKLRTLGGANADSAKLNDFVQIRPALNEQGPLDKREVFSYDFLKAICLWLDSGPGGIVRGFSKRTPSARFPLIPESGEEEVGIDAIDEHLIPYLLKAAGDGPILNIEASPFEVDEARVIFASERAAVLAFAQAVKIPFEDLTTGAVLPANPTSADRAAAQDRTAALRFWALKVGRGVLINAADGLDFRCVDHAFGGLGRPNDEIKTEERKLARIGKMIDAEEEEEEVQSATLVARTSGAGGSAGASGSTGTEEDDGEDEAIERELRVPLDVLANLVAENVEIEDVDEEIEIDDDHEPNEDDDDEDEMEDDGPDQQSSSDEELIEEDLDDDDDDEENGPHHILYRSGRLSSMHRSKVNIKVPVSSHTRSYEGHCNVKTVKDVNFLGLQDEYVASGSDSGHLFIWDRKTAKLVNILEGDGEVVNVIQGHPYEPMVAVSGIDHTIKIFSADAKARRDARMGVGVRKVDESDFSSIQGIGSRRRRRRPRPSDLSAESNLPTTINEAEAQAAAERRSWAEETEDFDGEEEDGRGNGPLVSDGGLTSRKRMWDEYRIRSQNDSERRGNMRGEYISRSMIHILMGRLREQLVEIEDEDGTGNGDPRQVVLDEDRCAVSLTVLKNSPEADELADHVNGFNIDVVHFLTLDMHASLALTFNERMTDVSFGLFRWRLTCTAHWQYQIDERIEPIGDNATVTLPKLVSQHQTVSASSSFFALPSDGWNGRVYNFTAKARIVSSTPGR